MKIVALSDIVRWENQIKVVDKIKPDVVVLAGDLTSDGFASFWPEAAQLIPTFQQELKQHNIAVRRVNNSTFVAGSLEKYNSIRNKYKNSEEYSKVRKTVHVEKFYEFLKYTGQKCKVLVVKGDHDDFASDYSRSEIDKISGCVEISGKIEKVGELNFLGIGFEEAHYLTELKRLIKNHKGEIDIIVTHCEQRRLPDLSEARPRLLIRGHFGQGKFLVNNVPTVMTCSVPCTVIDFEDEAIDIQQYKFTLDNKLELILNNSCRPWLSHKSEFELYPWLKPSN